MIVCRGEAYGETYNFKCKLIARTGEKAVFETISKPKHKIIIRPRYVGSGIGSHDAVDNRGRPITICAFSFDGKYAALAMFSEKGKNIRITPHEY